MTKCLICKKKEATCFECSDCYIKGAEIENKKGREDVLDKLKGLLRNMGRSNMLTKSEIERFIEEYENE